MTYSRISGFYNMTLAERLRGLVEASQRAPEDLVPFSTGGLSPDAADHMIENVIGCRWRSRSTSR
jgi:hydroxymethylglutaryl-CoA reductase